MEARRGIWLAVAVAVLWGRARADGPTGQIVGHILDPTGSPIRGVAVVVARKPPEALTMRAATDNQGIFRITGLPAGLYDVSASAPRLTSAMERDVSVPANGTVEVTLLMGLAPVPLRDPPEAVIGWRLAPDALPDVADNPFLGAHEHPLSTFSVEVGTASYASVRGFLAGGHTPPPDLVQIEELVNAFPYGYPGPAGDEPMAATFEVNDCPWNAEARLVRVGLRGAPGPNGARVAEDVKVRVELNPARVAAYRLIGYENRLLPAEDFSDEHEDAGVLRAGQAVTALYEIIPATPRTAASPELLTVKARFRRPHAWFGKERTWAVPDAGAHLAAATADFRFAAAVAAFGMILRRSPHRGSADHELVVRLARDALGEDRGGERRAFLALVEAARTIHAVRAD